MKLIKQITEGELQNQALITYKRYKPTAWQPFNASPHELRREGKIYFIGLYVPYIGIFAKYQGDRVRFKSQLSIDRHNARDFFI